MKRDGLELFFSIMLMFFSGFPLIEILSKSLVINQISNFSLIAVVVWLTIILISSFIYFVSYWMEKFDQLHFKGTVYTVPEIYQVKGLHNSSSLYKITHYSTLGRVWQHLKERGINKTKNCHLDLQLSRLEQQIVYIAVMLICGMSAILIRWKQWVQLPLPPL